jgi:DamX protein
MTSLSADDSYLTHYGFSHDPFAPRVPGFKFFPAQRKPVLGQLHHLARYSQLLLVVTGPEGSGKTLVRQALVASSNKQAVQSVVISPQDTLDSAALLQQVAQTLGSPRADYDSIMAQIIQLALTGQEVYLLVDDAERLTGAAVETLLRLAQGNPEGRPHVFLFGEHALVARLEALVEGEERFHVIALQPYEEAETREYIALRLEGAGGRLDCLSEEQLSHIHEGSGGWPGAINELARDELLQAMRQATGKRKSAGWHLSLPKKHLLALVAVIVVVAVALFMRDVEERPVEPTVASLPLELDSSKSDALGSEQQSQQATPVAPDQPVMREPLASAGGAEPDELAAESGLNVAEPALPVVPEPAMPAVPPVTAAKTVAPPSSTASEAPVRADVAKPAAAEPVAQAAAANWYADQPKTNYLIQVLGTRTRSKAEALVRQHGQGFRFFVKQHDGKPLYVVTYGSFSSRKAALDAAKGLPQALQSGKPWARSLASVQQEIAQAR